MSDRAILAGNSAAAIQRINTDERYEWFEDPADLVAAITQDLRHFCDANNLDYAACDKDGYEMYREDKR